MSVRFTDDHDPADDGHHDDCHDDDVHDHAADRDDDFNTTTTLVIDVDGDGWTAVDGDCCEVPTDGCTVPELVNPGAFDFAGDGIDDDCNGAVDDGSSACDQGLASDSSATTDYAKALDLCSETTESPPASQKRYGLISAALTLADGNGTPAVVSRSIRTAIGGVTGQGGDAMVVVSTGNAAAPGQVNPEYSAFEPGTITGTSSAAPADWLADNGGISRRRPIVRRSRTRRRTTR